MPTGLSQGNNYLARKLFVCFPPSAVAVRLNIASSTNLESLIINIGAMNFLRLIFDELEWDDKLHYLYSSGAQHFAVTAL